MPLKFGPAALSTPPADAASVEVTNRDTDEPAELTSDVEVLDHGQVTFTVAEAGRYLVTTTNGPVRSSRKVTLRDEEDDDKSDANLAIFNQDGDQLGAADRRAATDEHREPALQGHREPSGIEELELEAQAAAAAVSARPEATPAEEADKVEEPAEEEGTPMTEEEKARVAETEATSDPDSENPETTEVTEAKELEAQEAAADASAPAPAEEEAKPAAKKRAPAKKAADTES